MPRIIWRVQPAPTGQYRSFAVRGWPTAATADGRVVAQLRTDLADYSAQTAETTELAVLVANRSVPGPFKWRRLKGTPVGVKAAKVLVARFFETHPDWLPAKNN